ncbi:small subunit ribosomal protein S16 [Pedobacter sp. UYP30]|uniref:30S ribosomal protein S16 n=1 Tax=Pedobacter sp. UYP30 TaxID=1756400 RepID=UPI00339A1402
MATKIRLQRFGKKGKPFYHVVIADSRSPRDGKFIERLGSYNPNTNPATIDLDFDKTLAWVNKGAEPTDTVRAILSYKGILYKKHLEGGVKKGALTEEQAAEKFTAWLEAKSGKISGKSEGLATSKADARKAALTAEAKKKEDRAAAIAAKNAPLVEEVAEVEEAPVEEAEQTEAAPAEEVVAETPAPEAQKVEAPVAETPAAEEKTEDKA